MTPDLAALEDHRELLDRHSVNVALPTVWETTWAVYFARTLRVWVNTPALFPTATPPCAEWTLVRREAVPPDGTPAIELNATYSLVAATSPPECATTFADG